MEVFKVFHRFYIFLRICFFKYSNMKFLSIKYSLLLLFLFIVGIKTVDADRGAPYTNYGLAGRIASSCSGAVSATATFCDPTSPYAYTCYCIDPNALAMVAGCYHILDKMSPEFVSKLSENCEIWTLHYI